MERSTATTRAGWISVAFMLFVAAAAAQSPPLMIARDGYFFVGGQYFDGPEGRYMSGQMYVEFRVPRDLAHPYPIVIEA